MEKVSIFLADWQVLFREGIHFTLSGGESNLMLPTKNFVYSPGTGSFGCCVSCSLDIDRNENRGQHLMDVPQSCPGWCHW